MHELNFIQRHDKGLPTPQVLFRPLENVSGYYCLPWEGLEELPFTEDEDPLYNPNGLIVISTVFEDDIESTLAHEWRHHWQGYHYGVFPDWPWTPTEDRAQDLCRYFQMWHEADAFWFEYKHTKHTDFHSEVLDALRPSWYEPKKYSICLTTK